MVSEPMLDFGPFIERYECPSHSREKAKTLDNYGNLGRLYDSMTDVMTRIKYARTQKKGESEQTRL